MNKTHLSWLVVLCLPSLAIAASVTLRPVADTTLFSTYPNNNLGGSLTFVAGINGRGEPRRALIQFDPGSQIPSNAIIQSVTLTMKVMQLPANGGVSSTFDLHRLLVNWGEGTGRGNSGILATNGESTWNARSFSGPLWSQPGAAVSKDYSAAVSSSVLVGGVGSYTFSSKSNLVADVQAWLANSATNFGWILITESDRTPYTVRRFASREDTNNSPVLKVQYLPSPPQILGVDLSANSIQITFAAVAGQSYSVEYRDSLNSGAWLTLTNLGPQSVTANQSVADPILARSQRYYRIGTSF